MTAARALAMLLILTAAAPAGAGELALDRALVQGGLVEARVAPGSAVAIDGRKVRVSPEDRKSVV